MAAALQRVTGVQVARAGGEVGQVLVRGLPNVITTLDGRNVFIAVGRDMELADVPAELLRSVDVYKTTGA
nr:TonB-dependent receptor plug domain-containing protein [Xanthomonas axonopodis]